MLENRHFPTDAASPLRPSFRFPVRPVAAVPKPQSREARHARA